MSDNEARIKEFYDAFLGIVLNLTGSTDLLPLVSRVLVYYDDVENKETLGLGYSCVLEYLRDDVKEQVYTLSMLDDLIIMYVLPVIYPNLQPIIDELGCDRNTVKDIMFKMIFSFNDGITFIKKREDAPNAKYGYDKIKRILNTLNKIGLYMNKLKGRITLPHANDICTDIILFSIVELIYGMEISDKVKDNCDTQHYTNFMRFEGTGFQKSLINSEPRCTLDERIEIYDAILEEIIMIDAESKAIHFPKGNTKMC
ncbi:MAG: hypothetical protein ACRC92_02345 [Peptostreptococcaceae bacterium]